MTKKDYIVIANAIADERKHTQDIAKCHIDGVAELLAVRLAEQNPRFDAEKFLSACGINN